MLKENELRVADKLQQGKQKNQQNMREHYGGEYGYLAQSFWCWESLYADFQTSCGIEGSEFFGFFCEVWGWEKKMAESWFIPHLVFGEPL